MTTTTPVKKTKAQLREEARAQAAKEKAEAWALKQKEKADAIAALKFGAQGAGRVQHMGGDQDPRMVGCGQESRRSA